MCNTLQKVKNRRTGKLKISNFHSQSPADFLSRARTYIHGNYRQPDGVKSSLVVSFLLGTAAADHSVGMSTGHPEGMVYNFAQRLM